MIFIQRSAEAYSYRDAVRFCDGREILITKAGGRPASGPAVPHSGGGEGSAVAVSDIAIAKGSLESSSTRQWPQAAVSAGTQQ